MLVAALFGGRRAAAVAAPLLPAGIMVIGSDGRVRIATVGNGLTLDMTATPQPILTRADGITEVVHSFGLAAERQPDGSWVLPAAAHAPDPLDSLIVYRNGARQLGGGVDYTHDPLNAKRIVPVLAWDPGDQVICDLMY